MASFRYRAATPAGELKLGVLEAPSRKGALDLLRQMGLMPLETAETSQAATARAAAVDAGSRRQLPNLVGELSILLAAGLPLDRALAVCVENAVRPALKASLVELHRKVKEGAPLSRAMAEEPALWPPEAVAMAEAGEADGRLDASLGRLAEAMERAEALRQTLISAMIYPALLVVLAGGVILVMLLVVVPQFEGLFSTAQGQLPLATQAVLAASRALRAYGLVGALALATLGVFAWRWSRGEAARLRLDRALLGAPRVGALIRAAETARLARVLGSLIDGGVPLPRALGIALRSMSNSHMAAAVARVAAGLKEGGGLSRPLAATGLFPPLALSFLRTGEETARLGPMLDRLADVLDREVRLSVGRLVALLTPLITIVMGAVVAGVIASIMSAILGFNDLALPA